MRSIRLLRIGLLLLAGAGACANAGTGKLPVPVLLVLPAGQVVEIPDGGLIGAWISYSQTRANTRPCSH